MRCSAGLDAVHGRTFPVAPEPSNGFVWNTYPLVQLSSRRIDRAGLGQVAACHVNWHPSTFSAASRVAVVSLNILEAY